MFNNSSAKYYPNKQGKDLKEIVKGIKSFLKKSKLKSDNMVTNDIKISQKMKNESYLSIEKNIMKYVKMKMLHKLADVCKHKNSRAVFKTHLK